MRRGSPPPNCHSIPGRGCRGAFTLLELLAVITLVAILSGIVIGVGRRASGSGKIARAKAELAVIGAALETYKAVHGDYPRTDDEAQLLRALLGQRGPASETAITGRAMLESARFTIAAGVLMDPWERPYVYAYKVPADGWTNPRFVLYSAGLDQSEFSRLTTGYNTMPGVTPVTDVTARGNRIGNNFAAAATGKAASAPFTSLEGFAAYLATVFPDTDEPGSAEIMAALGPMLAVRSDTFRIRAYGEALNPADAAKIESLAYCEAIVQRTTGELPGFERRFAVIYFRWLGPDDI